MNFKEWLENEIKLFSSVDLSEEGVIYYNILKQIKEFIIDNNIELFLRKNIRKNNRNKKNYQYIYKQFLVYEGYIEGDLE